MKLLKKITTLLLIIAIIPLIVSAETVKTNGFEFEIKETNISCVPANYEIMAVYEEGKLVYMGYEMDGEEIKYKEDDILVYDALSNTCRDITAQDILDEKTTEYTNYTVDANSNGNVNIIENKYYLYEDAYILTKDTTVVADKFYYQMKLDAAGNLLAFEIVSGTPDAATLPTLYEIIYLTTPDKAEIKSGTTYYKYVINEEKFEVEVVADPKEEDILNYLVEYTGPREAEEKTVKEYKNCEFGKVANSLGHQNFGAIKLGSLNEYHFVVANTDASGTTTYDIYNQQGNKIYNGLKDLYDYVPLEDKGALVLTGNNKANVFDANLNLVKTFDDPTTSLIHYVNGSEYDTAYLAGLNGKVYQLKMTETEQTVTSPGTTNPNTSDKIIISIIIGVASIYGLAKLIKKYKNAL